MPSKLATGLSAAQDADAAYAAHEYLRARVLYFDARNALVVVFQQQSNPQRKKQLLSLVYKCTTRSQTIARHFAGFLDGRGGERDRDAARALLPLLARFDQRLSPLAAFPDRSSPDVLLSQVRTALRDLLRRTQASSIDGLSKMMTVDATAGRGSAVARSVAAASPSPSRAQQQPQPPWASSSPSPSRREPTKSVAGRERGQAAGGAAAARGVGRTSPGSTVPASLRESVRSFARQQVLGEAPKEAKPELNKQQQSQAARSRPRSRSQQQRTPVSSPKGAARGGASSPGPYRSGVASALERQLATATEQSRTLTESNARLVDAKRSAESGEFLYFSCYHMTEYFNNM